MRTTSYMIGSRCQETLERVDRLLVVEHEMDRNQISFLKQTKHRLMLYGQKTFMSAKQLNWITQLEDQYCERY